MATGINDEKLNAFKVELLNYTESINQIKEKLTNNKTVIQSNMEGPGKSEIISKLNDSINKLPKLNKTINNYISVVGKVINAYEDQDVEMVSRVSQSITKIESMKEE